MVIRTMRFIGGKIIRKIRDAGEWWTDQERVAELYRRTGMDGVYSGGEGGQSSQGRFGSPERNAQGSKEKEK